MVDTLNLMTTSIVTVEGIGSEISYRLFDGPRNRIHREGGNEG